MVPLSRNSPKIFFIVDFFAQLEQSVIPPELVCLLLTEQPEWMLQNREVFCEGCSRFYEEVIGTEMLSLFL